MTWRAARITTWLDGQKINDLTDNASVEPLYDTVIKAVNVQDTAVRSAVGLGDAAIVPKALVTSLTGDPVPR
ncbi:hypothetical protein [Microbispora rosea]|uniref:hypothetical protein n=1 Tax=Microbispora rosea TaxID=58117 RepID=UPI003D8C13B8